MPQEKMAKNIIILSVIILIAIRLQNAVLRRSTLRLYSRKVGFTDKIVHILL